MTQDPDQVVKGLRTHDPELLDRLIEEHQDVLFGYLLSLTRRRDAAEDFFQETWLRVLERGHQYKREWKFQNWLLTIARNLVIDEARRKKPASLDELREPERGLPWEPAAAETVSPLESLSGDQKAAALAAATRSLPEDSRQVYLLRMKEQLPLATIAEVLNLPLATVKSRLYRGVARLRTRLERCPA
jgi:RNA polymerase sigma-70 factor (ECF subfamily)